MWQYFLHLFGDVAELIWRLYRADERPNARWFTLGCGVVLLSVLGIIACLASRG